MRPKIAALTGMLVIAMAANAAQAAPDFAPASNVGWIAYGTEFIAPPTGPGPVKPDPQHPFVPDPIEYDPAAALSAGPDQSTFRVADLSNPILQPWAREELRKQNERVLSGAPGYTRQVACWPLGVPAFLLYPVQPVFFIQASKEITMVWQSYNIPRRIYLDVPHAASVIPSWFGDSVGHYEGDTLVVDTIGVTAKAPVDNYRTPHSDQLHVVERFRMIEDGKTLEVNIHVEDPGAFTTPWNAVQRFRRAERAPLLEATCAENNINPFHQDIEPMPVADKPDF